MHRFEYEDAIIECYGLSEDEVKVIKDLIDLYDKLGERQDLMHYLFSFIGSMSHNMVTYGKKIDEDVRSFIGILRSLGKSEKIKYVRVKEKNSSEEIEIFVHEDTVVIARFDSDEVYNVLNEIEYEDALVLIAGIVRETGIGGW